MWIIYLLLRIFVPYKELILGGDEARHLATAKNFYKLWNKQFYDTHPPLYSWLIKLFSKIMPDYKAGITVSLLSSLGLYFVCANLYHHLGLFGSQWLIAMGFITFNYTLIYYSNRIFRYELIVFLGTSTLFFLIIQQPFLAGICWGLTALTCSFAGLRMFWVWLIWFTGNISFVNLAPLFIWLTAYLSWIMTKVKAYWNCNYYPSGLDGKIEPVNYVTIKQLNSPMYFPFVYAYYGKRELGYDLKNWHKKIGGIFGLYWTKSKRLNYLIGALIILSGCATLMGITKAHLWVTLSASLLLYPSLYKRFLPRNSILATPLLGYLLAKGCPIVPEICLYFVFLGILAGFWWFNRCLLFPKPKWQEKTVSAYLKALPEDGILAEGLIAYSLAYLTDKRIVVIPHAPEKEEAIKQTDLSIKEFNLHYAVFSELYKTELHLGYPAIEYIKTFKLINTIQEEGDIFYIYEIFTHQPPEKRN